jgi:hypothetical protein
MKNVALVLVPLAFLVACGGDGSVNADVVQAATKGAGELGEQLAEKAGILARKAAEAAALKGEEARVKIQELVDLAAVELAAARDSKTVESAVLEVDQALAQLSEFVAQLALELDWTRVRQALADLAERFQNDPDVQRVLAALRERLDQLDG